VINGRVSVGNNTEVESNAIDNELLIQEDLIIPAFVGDLKVNFIGKCAFRSCKVIRRVNIEARIDVICNAAFEYCTSLESINIPSTLKVLEASAIRPTISGNVAPGSINITFEKGSKIRLINFESLRGKNETSIIFCDRREVTESMCSENLFPESENPKIYAFHSFCGYEPIGKPFGCYSMQLPCTNENAVTLKRAALCLINSAIILIARS
jgi:hypothetical protein